ncbi:Uncharacterised protein [Kingella potus]|uniref:Uncharacterized protein n=1 Tax=Kingella potus TaxID=265175 RepID=A0A377QZT1_9NEIS|nr:hypothetical protein [Kingella potus]UOP01327.1 hypothetical protein LVJ84_03515 [Kingella potus]STR00359.1 Uncharacterised protein [Kingella potus]
MKRSVLCPLLLCAVGLCYVFLFTCAVNFVMAHLFHFKILSKPLAVLLTVALATSFLFASPLLPVCRRLITRCGQKYGGCSGR